ncbi:MAG: prepilin-type N-terminal cleavage/methylation domain-containing protein [Lactimicrobium sp.]|uniref:type IV pilin protein n=1 Tax=Lactimicrobium sp. TaxID=2563780 RepID=UPI002F360647
MNNSRKKKGFTLAELLIVVAIIAVLVAISIPIFKSQLEKAREATDLANLRSAYAECSAAVLTEQDTGNAKVSTTDGSASETVTLTQKKDGWTGTNKEAKIGSFAVSGLTTTTGTATVKITSDGEVSITVGKAPTPTAKP